MSHVKTRAPQDSTTTQAGTESDNSFAPSEPSHARDSGRDSVRDSTMGIAVTSNGELDERARLPSQLRDDAFGEPLADAYVNLIGKASGIGEEFTSRSPGDRSSMISQTDRPRRKTWKHHDDDVQQEMGQNGTSSWEKVHRHSPIIAELKTNVIIKDEFTLVTDLSHHLAKWYMKPHSFIMIKVDHSACLALGGKFEPCYILTINAVPYEMGPANNMRNAALVQAFIADILSVAAERGIIKFEPIREENLAMGGTTMLPETERGQGDEEADLYRRSARKSLPSMSRKSLNKLAKQINATDSQWSSADLRTGSLIMQDPSDSPSRRKRGRSNPNQGVDSPDLYKEANPTATADSGQPTRNGLRMNGISAEPSSNGNPSNPTSRLPNGRPKTIGSAPSRSHDSAIYRDNSSHIARQSISGTPLPRTRDESGNSHRTARYPPNPRSNTTPGPSKSSLRPKSPSTSSTIAATAAVAQLPSHLASDPRATRNVSVDNTSSFPDRSMTPTPLHQQQPPYPPPNRGHHPTASTPTTSSHPRTSTSSHVTTNGSATARSKRHSSLTATPQLPFSNSRSVNGNMNGGGGDAVRGRPSMSKSMRTGSMASLGRRGEKGPVGGGGEETGSSGAEAVELGKGKGSGTPQKRRRSLWRRVVGKDDV